MPVRRETDSGSRTSHIRSVSSLRRICGGDRNEALAPASDNIPRHVKCFVSCRKGQRRKLMGSGLFYQPPHERFGDRERERLGRACVRARNEGCGSFREHPRAAQRIDRTEKPRNDRASVALRSEKDSDARGACRNGIHNNPVGRLPYGYAAVAFCRRYRKRDTRLSRGAVKAIVRLSDAEDRGAAPS